jgi:hypothetical protein
LKCRQGTSSGPRSHYAEVVKSQSKATSQSQNNSPLPPTDNSSACHQRPAQHPYAPAQVLPWVTAPPPIINKLPNLGRVVTDSFPVQLNNNFGDRPNSANRSQTDVLSQPKNCKF